jgi:glycogen operon protein
MTDEDWYAASSTLGVYVSGQGIPQRDARGEPVVDDSFLLNAHSHHRPVDFVLPAKPWAVRYEPVLDTAREAPFRVGAPVTAGSAVRVGARSVRLYRAVRP